MMISTWQFKKITRVVIVLALGAATFNQDVYSKSTSQPATTSAPASATFASATQPSAESTAKAFWTALANAELDEMKKFYADKVTLYVWSELLKPEWGITRADPRKNVEVSRTDLLVAYDRLIAKVGRERWRAEFGKVRWDDRYLSQVTGAYKGLPGIGKGDHILNVPVTPWPGEEQFVFHLDTLAFVLRGSDGGELRIVGESTVYRLPKDKDRGSD